MVVAVWRLKPYAPKMVVAVWRLRPYAPKMVVGVYQETRVDLLPYTIENVKKGCSGVVLIVSPEEVFISINLPAFLFHI